MQINNKAISLFDQLMDDHTIIEFLYRREDYDEEMGCTVYKLNEQDAKRFVLKIMDFILTNQIDGKNHDKSVRN